MVKLSKPWLLLPVKFAHDIFPTALSLVGKFRPFKSLPFYSYTWRDLDFANPIGIAGGVDKNVETVQAWWSYGAGFTEVGTITPLAQKANPGVNLRRNLKNFALWNSLGFPSKGVKKAKINLSKIPTPHFTPIFVNIGKNRTTTNENAHKDYIKCISELEKYTDVFVINISSPNTANLRDLFKKEVLTGFLTKIIKFNNSKLAKPILLKLSPDMNREQLLSVLDISITCKIDGWIFTNTSNSPNEKLKFPKHGGVSGLPLKDKSLSMLKTATSHLKKLNIKDKLVVSCGGIFDLHDMEARLDAGANLTQVYSALVFKGPNFFKEIQEEFYDKQNQ